MWPIEVIKAVNDPEKYAKTEKQKEAIRKFRETTGFSISLDKKTGLETDQGLE